MAPRSCPCNENQQGEWRPRKDRRVSCLDCTPTGLRALGVWWGCLKCLALEFEEEDEEEIKLCPTARNECQELLTARVKVEVPPAENKSPNSQAAACMIGFFLQLRA